MKNTEELFSIALGLEVPCM